jgi:hypothetical protein
MSKFKNLKGKATEKQKAFLKARGIKFNSNLSKQEASNLITNTIETDNYNASGYMAEFRHRYDYWDDYELLPNFS